MQWKKAGILFVKQYSSDKGTVFKEQEPVCVTSPLSQDDFQAQGRKMTTNWL